MSSTFIHCLIKFGNKEFIEDLFENGTVYCNPLQYFKTLEDKFRGDNYEGTNFIKNYPPGQFSLSIAGKKIDHDFNYLNLHLRSSRKVLGNIYSLYSLSSRQLKGSSPIRIDKRVKDFGDTALLIKDNVKFLSLLEKALNKRRLNFEHGLVEYYDRNIYTGAVDIFNKPSEYSYQNEFRFYIRRRSDEPLIVRIGSLKEVAEMFPAEAFIDSFEAIQST